MLRMLVIARQVMALIVAFWFYADIYKPRSEISNSLPRQLVELFLLVLIFYVLFFIGKIFSWYWRRVKPKPKSSEVFVITLFENFYLPIVALYFPIYVEEIFLKFKMGVNAHGLILNAAVLILLLILIDFGGSIRNSIYVQNKIIREKSVLKLNDSFAEDSSSILRWSLSLYYFCYLLLGFLILFI